MEATGTSSGKRFPWCSTHENWTSGERRRSATDGSKQKSSPKKFRCYKNKQKVDGERVVGREGESRQGLDNAMD